LAFEVKENIVKKKKEGDGRTESENDKNEQERQGKLKLKIIAYYLSYFSPILSRSYF